MQFKQKIKREQSSLTHKKVIKEGVDPVKAGQFENFDISKETQKNLVQKGIEYLFPIQVETYDTIFRRNNVIGRDRTGSGKTLAFSLPILERMRKQNKLIKQRAQQALVMVLVPTRELAIQVNKEFQRFKNFPNEYRSMAVYGGNEIQQQILKIKNGVEVIIGTPGRILDLQNRGILQHEQLEVLIMDETDIMLNFGFQEDIEKIMKNINSDLQRVNRQNSDLQYLLFSATVPKWVYKISQSFLDSNYYLIDMVQNQDIKTSKTVKHLIIRFNNRQQKINSIADIAIVYGGPHSRTIIFTDKKSEANEILLSGKLKTSCQVLHGEIPQKQREVVFQSFKDGSIKCLIATNVAARGLDIPEVDLIIQLTPPQQIDSYIHRSGRTGRAGNEGTCITFYTKDEYSILEKIENSAKIRFKKVGTPQIQDIIQANARDIKLGLDKVSEDVLEYFKSTSQQIFDKYEPEEAMCRALAVITGYTNIIKQRSLLSSAEGFVTMILNTNYQIRSIQDIWQIFQNYFSQQIVDTIKNLKLLMNFKGVVFDIPLETYEIFKNFQQNYPSNMDINGFQISKAKILPEFFDCENQYNQDNNYKNNRYKKNSFGDKSFNQKKNNYQRNQYQKGYQQPLFKKGQNFNKLQDNSYNQRQYKQQNSQGQYYNNNYQRRDFKNQDERKNNMNLQRYEQNSSQNNSQNNQQKFQYSNSDKNQKFKQQKKNYNYNEPSNKLFLANIPFVVSEQQINQILNDKGYQPLDTKILRDEEGRSRGSCFVKFQNTEIAQNAKNDIDDLIIQGRSIKVSYAKNKY